MIERQRTAGTQDLRAPMREGDAEGTKLGVRHSVRHCPATCPATCPTPVPPHVRQCPDQTPTPLGCGTLPVGRISTKLNVQSAYQIVPHHDSRRHARRRDFTSMSDTPPADFETNDLAPSFGGLTAKQSAFVIAYVSMGSQRGAATNAALAAGYGGGVHRKAATARAHELLRHDDVLRAIKAEATRKLSAASVIGVNVMIELATDPATPAAVRLSAAKELVDRGHGPVMSRNAHIVATRSIEDIISALDMEDAARRSADADVFDIEPDWRDEHGDAS